MRSIARPLSRGRRTPRRDRRGAVHADVGPSAGVLARELRGLLPLPGAPLRLEDVAVAGQPPAQAQRRRAPRPRSAASSRRRTPAGCCRTPRRRSTGASRHRRRARRRTGPPSSRSGGRRRPGPRPAARRTAGGQPGGGAGAASSPRRRRPCAARRVSGPSAAASRAAKVVLPDPAGPSMHTSRVRAEPRRGGADPRRASPARLVSGGLRVHVGTGPPVLVDQAAAGQQPQVGVGLGDREDPHPPLVLVPRPRPGEVGGELPRRRVRVRADRVEQLGQPLLVVGGEGVDAVVEPAEAPLVGRQHLGRVQPARRRRASRGSRAAGRRARRGWWRCSG